MTPHERLAAAQHAVKRFIASSLFNNSQHIGCYFAHGAEFDVGPLIEAIWAAGKNCYLPILSAQQKGVLDFGAYEKSTPLKQNKYNILEPVVKDYFPIQQLDLVLMPLVGFDLQGHRLGMGGGYYDKTFEFLQNKKHTKPIMLGIAFEKQKSTEIPTESWDISMDAVLTENQLYIFEKHV